MSCSTCWRLTTGGSDGLTRSREVGARSIAVNAPAIFDDGLDFHQFRDRRTNIPQDQAAMLVHDEGIMTPAYRRLLSYLDTASACQRGLKQLDPELLMPRTVSVKSVAFERHENHRRKREGCAIGGRRVNVGGDIFDNPAVMGDGGASSRGRGHIDPADLGRFQMAHGPGGVGVLTVPILRDVGLAAPHLHDGSAATRQDAVETMLRDRVDPTASAKTGDLIANELTRLARRFLGNPLDCGAP